MLDVTAEKYPSETALISEDESISYKELNAMCERFARGLLSIDVKKGDKVAIWAPNIPEWIIALFGIAKIGAVTVTLNTSYQAHEIDYVLWHGDVTTLILVGGVKNNNFLQVLEASCPNYSATGQGTFACDKFPLLKNLIFIGEDAPEGMLPWGELLEKGDTVSNETFQSAVDCVDANDVCTIIYTSGTTGTAKGVLLTHRNIVNNGKDTGDSMMLSERDRLCNAIPLFHSIGLVHAIIAFISHGAAQVLVKHYNPENVMRAVSEKKCTALHGVPTVFITILGHPDFDKYDFSSLRTGIIGGSNCPVPLMKEIIQRLNMSEIVILYGLTECSGATRPLQGDPLDWRISTIGKPLPFIECCIMDADKKELPVGQEGEICVRGYNVTPGYYKNETCTLQSIQNGWFHTNDLGKKDADGNFHITGRVTDTINRGGENISPREIEEFLDRHPAVSAVTVVGVPSAKYGDEIFACVILKSTEEPTRELAEDIRQFASDNLASYKVPRYVEFVESYPLTANGKVKKNELREWAIAHYHI
jgi:fatty-acyl-CoA synthase